MSDREGLIQVLANVDEIVEAVGLKKLEDLGVCGSVVKIYEILHKQAGVSRESRIYPTRDTGSGKADINPAKLFGAILARVSRLFAMWSEMQFILIISLLLLSVAVTFDMAIRTEQASVQKIIVQAMKQHGELTLR